MVVLFVSSIVGTLFYYEGIIQEKDNRIASIRNEIANLNSTISNLNSQLADLSANLTTPHLVSSVTATNYSALYIAQLGGGFPPSNFLEITGSVTNSGGGTAFNAGLHVLAYDASGNVQINMTVPLSGGTFATDDKILSLFKSYPTMSVSSSQLGNLTSGKTVTVTIDIYHEGAVNNWVITPVWTRTPKFQFQTFTGYSPKPIILVDLSTNRKLTSKRYEQNCVHMKSSLIEKGTVKFSLDKPIPIDLIRDGEVQSKGKPERNKWF